MKTGTQKAYNLGWKLRCVLDGAPASLLDITRGADAGGGEGARREHQTVERDYELKRRRQAPPRRGHASAWHHVQSYVSQPQFQRCGFESSAGDRALDAPGPGATLAAIEPCGIVTTHAFRMHQVASGRA